MLQSHGIQEAADGKLWDVVSLCDATSRDVFLR